MMHPTTSMMQLVLAMAMTCLPMVSAKNLNLRADAAAWSFEGCTDNACSTGCTAIASGNSGVDCRVLNAKYTTFDLNMGECSIAFYGKRGEAVCSAEEEIDSGDGTDCLDGSGALAYRVVC